MHYLLVDGVLAGDNHIDAGCRGAPPSVRLTAGNNYLPVKIEIIAPTTS